MKLLIALAAVLAVAASNQVQTTPKVVCYYDSKSYVRECKYLQIFKLSDSILTCTPKVLWLNFQDFLACSGFYFLLS